MFPITSTLLLVTTALQVNAAPNCDLKSIFQTPARRNYDNLEILERSNFDNAAAASGVATDAAAAPRSYANAQIQLRFSDAATSPCACGSQCQCRAPPPCCMPHPQCVCYAPPYMMCPCCQNTNPPPPPPATINSDVAKVEQQNVQVVIENSSQANQINVVQNSANQNANVEITNNHPKILNEVQLPDIVDNGEVIFALEEGPAIQTQIEMATPTLASPNVQFVTLEVNKGVDPIPPTVSYPLIPDGELIKLLRYNNYPVGYGDPLRGLLYSVLLNPQSGIVATNEVIGGAARSDVITAAGLTTEVIGDVIQPCATKFVCIPVEKPVPTCNTNCGCSSCRYVGELNEQTM